MRGTLAGAAFASILLASSGARADLLDPNAFASLGAFPGLRDPGMQAPDIIITTSGTPQLIATYQTGPNSVLSGVVSSSGVAVFDFDAVDLQGRITAYGSRALAILSRGDLNVAGMIDVSGHSTTSIAPIGPGPGGYAYGTGPGQGMGTGGSQPQFSDGYFYQPGSGGGGFGGAGGGGGSYAAPVPFASGPGLAGGPAYGDLARRLEGGSAGGGGPNNGNGGGAVELGAVGNVAVSGVVRADGAGARGSLPPDAGGGGSGGGVLVHGRTFSLTTFGTISARGGSGVAPTTGFPASGRAIGGSGGGGGGVVYISTASTLSLLGSVDVSGGRGSAPNTNLAGVADRGADGGVGRITAVPEPASLLLLALGTVALAGVARRRASRGPGLPDAGPDRGRPPYRHPDPDRAAAGTPGPSNDDPSTTPGRPPGVAASRGNGCHSGRGSEGRR